MARSAREPLESYIPERERRPELIRPSERRQEFTERKAQRRLLEKERRWAPVAYGVFLLAILAIFSVSYTSYAFSKYRNQVLPGVRVDNLDLSGLTEKQAVVQIDYRLNVIHRVPFRLVFKDQAWEPQAQEIGLGYGPKATAQSAMAVGRAGSFVQQLFDRLPLHQTHPVDLVYYIKPSWQLWSYIEHNVAEKRLDIPPQNAELRRVENRFVLVPSVPGTKLDVLGTVQKVRAVLGSLTKQSVALHVRRSPAAISNNGVLAIRAKVEKFLNHTPVVSLGKRVVVTSRDAFAPMLSFADKKQKGHWSVVMTVDSNKVRAYVRRLAAQVDRPAKNPRVEFSGGQVTQVTPLQRGRTLDQDAAFTKLLAVVSGLHAGARLHFKVTVTNPPVDQTNPASLGIRTLLATGRTSFPGADSTRTGDISGIAKSLDNTLIAPDEDISFNTLVTSAWPDRMYVDKETESNGELVPSSGGAMQQVATTFLRAMFAAGLQVEERHSHTYRLPWYEPPVGLDAIVAPARVWDLRFANTTHKYLLLQTRVEPIRQELYIYVYGPNLGWHVAVDGTGKVTQTVKHGPQIVRQDSSLAPGDVRQVSWAHDGAFVVVRRRIRSGKGKVKVDSLETTYQPSQAIISVGSVAPTPVPTATSTPTTKEQRQATPAPTSQRQTPTPTPAPPAPTVTSTFDH